MKISILSTAPPYRGGISEQTYLMHSHLKKNHNVQIINFKRQYPSIFFPGKNQYDDKINNIENSIRVVDSINPLTWTKAANLVNNYGSELVLIRFWNPFFAISHGTILKQINEII